MNSVLSSAIKISGCVTQRLHVSFTSSIIDSPLNKNLINLSA